MKKVQALAAGLARYPIGEKKLPDGSPTTVPGSLAIARNSDESGNLLPAPNTILIDSEQLESGEAMRQEAQKVIN